MVKEAAASCFADQTPLNRPLQCPACLPWARFWLALLLLPLLCTWHEVQCQAAHLCEAGHAAHDLLLRILNAMLCSKRCCQRNHA